MSREQTASLFASRATEGSELHSLVRQLIVPIHQSAPRAARVLLLHSDNSHCWHHRCCTRSDRRRRFRSHDPSLLLQGQSRTMEDALAKQSSSDMVMLFSHCCLTSAITGGRHGRANSACAS